MLNHALPREQPFTATYACASGTDWWCLSIGKTALAYKLNISTNQTTKENPLLIYDFPDVAAVHPPTKGPCTSKSVLLNCPEQTHARPVGSTFDILVRHIFMSL
jgi:hypothetical protein